MGRQSLVEQQAMRAMILAGSKGSEIQPLTSNLPKPIVPLGNIPFIFYQLDVLKKAGLKDIVLLLSYQPRKIQEILGDGSNYGLVIHYVTEPEPLGTAGAIKNAAALFDQTVLILNGDILTAVDLQEILDQHRQNKVPLTLVEGSSATPERCGMILANGQGMVTGFIEKPRGDELKEGHANVGIYIMEREVLDHIPDSTHYTLERELMPQLIRTGLHISAHHTDAYWCHIGDPYSYHQANLDVLSGRVPLPNFFGLYTKKPMTLPPGCRVDEKSFIHESCMIKEGVVIENSVIGEKCRLEERVLVRNSVILSGTRLKKGAQLHSCVVGKNCLLGESVAIRKGGMLGDKSLIADFSRI
jgi:NDP-sugar pyrophosphorylase family protein